MGHWSQDNGIDDIVDALGITGTKFRRTESLGKRRYFNVRDIRRSETPGRPRYASGTPPSRVVRRLSWQRGRHSLKFGASYRRVIWPMWALVQSRGLLQFTPGFTTETENNDGTGSALASFLLGLPASRQVQAGVPA